MQNNLHYLLSLQASNPYIITFLKMFVISMCTYYMFLKISAIKDTKFYKHLFVSLLTSVVIFIYLILKQNLDFFIPTVFLYISLSSIYALIYKNTLRYTFIATIISLSTSYILFAVSIILSFFVNVFISIRSELINFLIIASLHILFSVLLFKIKRFKDGFPFLKSLSEDDYFYIIFLIICTVTLFSFIIFVKLLSSKDIFYTFIIFSIIMFITIRKSITSYYKYNLLVKELNDLKSELDKKDEEIQILEKENLDFSKTSHSIAHKQQALEYKLKQLSLKTEIANELDITEEANKLSNEYKENANEEISPSIDRTGIESIDDILDFLYSECQHNKISFSLKLFGNIHQMINNAVSENQLEILLADHIKDAMIAIRHSTNVNKSILVKLGLIDDIYSMYVYDSGIEFDKDTLLDLGTKPLTTHEEDGGTGLGFMNTFDTLKQTNASLCIYEIDKPNKDNYTKAIIVKFDNKNDLIIKTYRADELKKLNKGLFSISE